MLKFGFEYSFYIFDEYLRNDDSNLLCLIYIYNSVVQTLWLASADFKTNKYWKCIGLVPAEPSTIYGGSNSSAYSLKAPETIRASWHSG